MIFTLIPLEFVGPLVKLKFTKKWKMKSPPMDRHDWLIRLIVAFQHTCEPFKFRTECSAQKYRHRPNHSTLFDMRTFGASGCMLSLFLALSKFMNGNYWSRSMLHSFSFPCPWILRIFLLYFFNQIVFQPIWSSVYRIWSHLRSRTEIQTWKFN